MRFFEYLKPARALAGKVPGWIWAGLAALVLLAALFSSCQRATDAERQLRAAHARAELRAKDLVPVEPVPDVRPQLLAAEKENEAFRAELARLRKNLAGAKAELHVHAETEPTEIAAGPPRPPEPEGSSPLACVLAQGDRVKLKLEFALLRGDDGVAGVAGAMEAWAFRDMAEPFLLVRQPFAGKLTSAEEVAPPIPVRRARFALGARAWWASSGSAPNAADLNAGLRLLSGWWVDGVIRTDGAKAVGFRREF